MFFLVLLRIIWWASLDSYPIGRVKKTGHYFVHVEAEHKCILCAHMLSWFTLCRLCLLYAVWRLYMCPASVLLSKEEILLWVWTLTKLNKMWENILKFAWCLMAPLSLIMRILHTVRLVKGKLETLYRYRTNKWKTDKTHKQSGLNNSSMISYEISILICFEAAL